MRWSSTLSVKPDTDDALAEAAALLEAGLAGTRPDLLVVFASPHHARTAARLAPRLRARFPGARLIGCTGGGIIGGGREIEGRSALSLTGASLPAVELVPLRLPDPRGLPPRGSAPRLVVLADPFSCDVESVIEMLDGEFPGAPKIGGLASGGGAGEAALFLDGETLHDGAVGLALTGDVALHTIVAQGARPIGQPMIITRCEHNIILEVGGRSPLAVLRELRQSLPERDRKLFGSALHVGLEMAGQRVEYKAGDFLVRNVLGVDPESGALAVGALPRRFQTLQFHLRDAGAATEDLLACFDRRRAESGGARPSGALLFSCLGRGERFFGRPDHDSELFRERVGPVPLGGFFCNGEIGPVGERTFLHGYTSSFGLFQPSAS